MTEYVLHTEPLIAYLYDEPGASAVTERLQVVDRGEVDAAISHATATELVYKIARLETGIQIRPSLETPTTRSARRISACSAITG